MNLTKEITLTGYTVEYFDLRQPKPRTMHTETCVLDGGRLNALHRLNKSGHGYIAKLYEAQGFGGVRVIKGKTISAPVDLAALWAQYGPKGSPADEPQNDTAPAASARESTQAEPEQSDSLAAVRAALERIKNEVNG